VKPENEKALKEWATVVKALGEGKQTILVRSGRFITKREGKLKFTYDEFFLYPTFTKQTKDKFKEQFHSDFDAAITARVKDKIMLEFYVQIKEIYEVAEIKKLVDLDSYYVWTSSHVEDYFQETKDKKLYVITLRVFKLPRPEFIKVAGRTGMTWVNLPNPISTQGYLPVLKDDEFKNKVGSIKQIIGKPPEEGPDHTKIKEMIYQIGLDEGRPSEKEYSIGGLGKLDVAWKRIRLGNPTHAFEVQIAGDFFKSLAKLKHAFDLWNSIPVLVTTSKFEEIAKNLMNGSFHEMTKQARIINWKKIEQLYKSERELREIKRELRL